MSKRFGSKAPEVTQDYVLSRFHYEPATGVMTRRVATTRSKVGSVVGSLRKDGYLAVNIRNYPFLVHRLAWLYVHGEWPENIDHINHDRADNRLCNLRSVSPRQNLQNQTLRCTNARGVAGVHWDKSRRKWAPKIGVNGRLVNLGRFDDFFEACCARKSAEAQYGFHRNHGRAA